MNRDQIRAKVQEILSEIVEQEVRLTDATSAADVSWWDSLTHLKLLVAIEADYDVKFTVAELSAPETVGQLVELIQKKIAS